MNSPTPRGTVPRPEIDNLLQHTCPVSAAAALGAAVTTAHDEHGGIPFVVLPEGYQAKPLEALQDEPYRTRGEIRYADVAHFAVAWLRFTGPDKLPELATLYGVIDESPKFAGIVNDGGWRDHRLLYNCPLSKEWKIWVGSNGKTMAQADFARFIEDNAPDCLLPDSASMIEIARTLEAKKGVNFASGIRLSDGQTEFTYQEAIDATAGKGRFQVPEQFSLNIPVLVGLPNYEVTARLRYRIGEGGKLTMWYDLLRPHKILEHAVNDVWATIEEKTQQKIMRVEAIPEPIKPITG